MQAHKSGAGPSVWGSTVTLGLTIEKSGFPKVTLNSTPETMRQSGGTDTRLPLRQMTADAGGLDRKGLSGYLKQFNVGISE